MDLTIDKDNVKNMDKDIKYVFELQKDNYNEIKIRDEDLNIATESLKQLFRNIYIMTLKKNWISI